MTRVLHVVQSLDPSWGGIARVLPDLAQRLSAVGVESCIATLAGGRYGNPPESAVRIETFAASNNGLGSSPAFHREAEGLIKGVDVVHLHGLWSHQNAVAGRLARRLGKPYIMTPHSMLMPWAWNRSWWKKRPIGWLFEHRNLRKAAFVHALSNGEADAIRARRFNSRVRVIPNGIEPSDYTTSPDAADVMHRFTAIGNRRWMLFLSRIHPQKGIADLVEAFLDVAADAPDWRLIIAGPDEVGLKAELEQSAKRRGIADRIVFAGMVDRVTARVLLHRAELLVQPSLSEGLSMTLLESLSCGTPVLISPACNMPDVVECGAGVMTEPNRTDIASELQALMARPALELADMGRRGRALVEQRYRWSVVLPQYASMYADARRTV